MSKTGQESKKINDDFDYNPDKDIYKRILKNREEQKKITARIKSMKNVSSIPIPNPIIASLTPNSGIRIDGNPTTGSMVVNVPLLVNGRDVLKELDEMRDALLLLKRDVKMEEKYPLLKDLKDQYEQALEKYKTFEALK